MSAGPAVACLMYHEVTDDPVSTGFQRPGARPYILRPADFTEHMEEVAAAGLVPALITSIDLHQPGRHLLLSFDDGGRSALEAAEELARRQWRAHFFVVTGRIGGRTFLDAGQIRHLQSCGHLVGSHSHTHPDIFSSLAREAMTEEWRVSAGLLADLLGEAPVAASVPGGDLSLAVIESAAAAGFRYLFTSEPWLTPRRENGCWVLGRNTVKAWTSAATIRARCRFRGWTTDLLVRRAGLTARHLFPSAYRQYVRWTTAERAGSGSDAS